VKRPPASATKLALDSLSLPITKKTVQLMSKILTDTLVLSSRINRIVDGSSAESSRGERSSLIEKTCLKLSGLISGNRNAQHEASAI